MDSSARADSWEHLRAALTGGVPPRYVYPDVANGMEQEVISPKGRAEERALWRELVDNMPRGAGLAWDAGCGLGAFTALLSERFAHVLCTDADATRVARARALAPPQAEFHALPLLDPRLSSDAMRGAFALVQCIQVLGHLPIDEVLPTLAVLKAAVAPGGGLLLAVPFSTGGADTFWVTGRADDVIAGAEVTPQVYDAVARTPQPGVLPIRHFSMPTLQRLGRQAHLSVVQVRPYNWLHATRADVMLLLQP